MLETPNFVGWRNYIKLLLDDDVFKKAFKNTIIFAVITGPLSYIMCFLFAWIINEFKGKLRAFLTLIFYAPSISGNAFMVWAIIISGDRYGYLNGWLMKWSFLYEPIQWMKTEKYVLPILIIVQLWLSLGTGFLTFIAGLQTVDKSLYEAGAMDGIKNRWQELWYITIPSMRPQLMFGAVMQITQSFAVADISINLAGNPSVNYSGATIVTHLIDYGSGTRYEMGYACAIATVLFALRLEQTRSYKKQSEGWVNSLKRKKDYYKKPSRWKIRHTKQLNRSMAGNTILFVIMGICGVFMALPLVMILNNALKPLDELFRYPPQIFVRNPSLDNFSDLYVLMSSSWVPFTRYVLNTLIITGLGTVGHVLFASLAAYPLAKHDFPGKKFLFSMVVLSLMFSYNVTAIPNYMIISWLGINNTYLAVILPAFAYGLGLYLMKQFMEQIPDSLIESARLDGAGEFRIFFSITCQT